MKKYLLKTSVSLFAAALATMATPSNATIVEFETSLGNFKINLHDQTTPKTVENFLRYINNGDYDDTIIHRTVDNFVVQGGGAIFEGELPPRWIDTYPAIENEPVYSNVSGTISMAKLAGDVNSATSQWFINTKDNSQILDPIDSSNSGAYAVFGEVIDDGMQVVNAIANVERCNTGYSGFTELPMPNYAQSCGDSDAMPGQQNFVTIYTVSILDDSADTAATLAGVKNTRVQTSAGVKNTRVQTSTQPDPTVPAGNSSSGGGILWWLLLPMGILTVLRRKPA